MKNILAVGLLVSSAFFSSVQVSAQANERGKNNDCNNGSSRTARSQGCLPGGSFRRDRPPAIVQQPPVIVQPQPNPPAVVQNPPQYNNGYGRGYGDGYRGDWNRNRNQSGVYFNFQTDPYYNTYNDPNYYDEPYYNDQPTYYSDPYPPRYNSYSRPRVSKCSSIARSLRNSGYSKVRSQKCSGRNYIYTALRDGDRLRLTVSSSSGRILSIRRSN
jgi:hypothetical protein